MKLCPNCLWSYFYTAHAHANSQPHHPPSVWLGGDAPLDLKADGVHLRSSPRTSTTPCQGRFPGAEMRLTYCLMKCIDPPCKFRRAAKELPCVMPSGGQVRQGLNHRLVKHNTMYFVSIRPKEGHVHELIGSFSISNKVHFTLRRVKPRKLKNYKHFHGLSV